jgi:hypothetical protein
LAEVFRIPDKLYDRIVDAPWIIGRLSTPVGEIPRVAAGLGWKDILGSWGVRWGINRMRFVVEPGLYCVGAPDANSPVLVTANYKLSFDRLRQQLQGIPAWIMVLDTQGINVWCAAGKGTFGTTELIRRIARVGLDQVVNHRVLVLPQLGATGVAAYEVRKKSGFKVVYGPVRAEDIPAFLQAGMKADAEMRRVLFGFWDRLILTPIEIRGILTKPAVLLAALLLFIANLVGWTDLNAADIYPYAGAVLIGTVITPALLPWIPGPAFAWKGGLLGMLWAAGVVYGQSTWSQPGGLWSSLAQFLILPAISAYLALQFTGASTYTSFSGVVKETKAAMPIIKMSAALGVVALIITFLC